MSAKKFIHNVTVFGYSESLPNDEEYIAAYDVSKLLAQNGFTIVNGGGPGVMYAASKGAKDGGGEVEVVYYEPQHVSHFEGKMNENLQIVDRASQESNYLERTRELLERGDAYIVFNGGTGTVSEFAMSWALARLYFEKHKPLIFYGPFWRNILDAFWKNMRVRENEYKVFKYATTPNEVLQYLLEYERMYERYMTMTPEECKGDECELFLLPHEHRKGEHEGRGEGAAEAEADEPAEVEESGGEGEEVIVDESKGDEKVEEVVVDEKSEAHAPDAPDEKVDNRDHGALDEKADQDSQEADILKKLSQYSSGI